MPKLSLFPPFYCPLLSLHILRYLILVPRAAGRQIIHRRAAQPITIAGGKRAPIGQVRSQLQHHRIRHMAARLFGQDPAAILLIESFQDVQHAAVGCDALRLHNSQIGGHFARALVVRGIAHEGRHYLYVEAAAEGLMYEG